MYETAYQSNVPGTWIDHCRKGKHFDGSEIEKGEVIAWNKDKYNLFRQQVRDSFVADCAMAVLKALENCISKEKFIEK